jgi:cell division protein FtsQ
VLLVTVAVVVACVVFFRVNTVTVTGCARYSEEEVLDVAGIQTGDNLVALPKNKIASRILNQLPYVRSVSIRRVLPDGVTIAVTEHEAAAAVSDGSSWWYIAAQKGKLLEQVATPGSVMQITGLTAVEPMTGKDLQVDEEEQARLSYVLTLLEVLEGRGELGICSGLDCSSTGVIWLDYLDFRLKMPTTGDFSYYLAMLDQIFATGDRVARTDSGTFDFSVTEGKAFYSPNKEE